MRVHFIPPAPKKHPLAAAISVKKLVMGPTPDLQLIFCVFGLLVFGWVMVYSSSALFAETRYHDQYFFFKKQLMWSVLGMGAFVVAANIPLEFWQKGLEWLRLRSPESDWER
jgi:cell division protein FtsW (lipid II flippase)